MATLFNEDNTAEIDGFSKPVVFLELLCNEKTLATATGMVARFNFGNGGDYLVTALHNLTGLDEKRRILHSGGIAVPDAIRIHRHEASAVVYPLLDERRDARFLCHSDPKVDVSVLPLGRLPAGHTADKSFFDPVAHAQTVKLYVGQMCYVVGFPETLVHRHPVFQILPYWTTGHVASEPRATLDGYPVFIIDAATAQGLSGAPVWVRDPRTGCNRVLGIYSGRILEDVEVDGKKEKRATQLGKVFGVPLVMNVASKGQPWH